MMRLVVSVAIFFIFRIFVKPTSGAADESKLSAEKAEFIERKAEETYKYVLDSYDLAKAEGKNVLQWLFAAVFGGLGLTGTLVQNAYYSVAMGALLASIWAAISACRLIGSLHARNIIPPGNSATTLKTIAHYSLPTMRRLEAEGLDEGNVKNQKVIEDLRACVDKGRRAMAFMPWWFIGGALVASAVRAFVSNATGSGPMLEFLRQFPL